MLNDKFVEIKKRKNDLTELYRELYLLTLPIEIVAKFNECTDYMCVDENLIIVGYGLNLGTKRLNKPIPVIRNYPKMKLTLSETRSNDVQKELQEIEKLQENYDLLLREIQQALIQFGTSKKAIAGFPECEKFLPKEQEVFLPSVNILSIQEKLKS